MPHQFCQTKPSQLNLPNQITQTKQTNINVVAYSSICAIRTLHVCGNFSVTNISLQRLMAFAKANLEKGSDANLILI